MFKTLLRNNRDLFLAFGMILILTVLFVPIPPMALDLAILINFGFSLTILLLTFYVARPVEFSTFPSLLLIATLLRLSLNVAATRLILTDASAGDVIGSIGSFAAGGNFVVGLVVFFILIVVQYVVVTSGAQRVSEVAARFTLDSMPGQQMSIDADLNMGLIDQAEAIRRRADLEKEASFYGSMDGASKFVKGDAIAGIIILLINIIAGWIIGVAQLGMSWDEALKRFSLLTIGDGIATQLPALIISIATGIIMTRSSSDRDLSTEVMRQLTLVPRIPLMVCGILGMLLLLPGMPKWPIAIMMAISAAAWFHMRRLKRETPETAGDDVQPSAKTAEAPPVLSVAFGPALGKAWAPKEAILLDRLASLRAAQENALGFGFPAVSFVDGVRLSANEYEIRLFGTRYAGGDIEAGRVLAIRNDAGARPLAGTETVDPAFGLPAFWIDENQSAAARENGYTLVDPVTVFMTHVGEVLKNEVPQLMTRAEAVQILDGVRARQPGLVEEIVPAMLSVADMQRVLQALLAERVSVAHADRIFEHIADLGRAEKDPGQLTESLRQRMGHVICARLKDRHKDLAVLSLDPRLENQITATLSMSRTSGLSIEPKLAEQILRKTAALVADMVRQGREPVLLCGGDIRRPLKSLTRRSLPGLSVLSVQEIPPSIDLSSFGVIRTEAEDAATRTDSTLRAAETTPRPARLNA
jgi:flagellar biosynthesis protein FlhA